MAREERLGERSGDSSAFQQIGSWRDRDRIQRQPNSTPLRAILTYRRSLVALLACTSIALLSGCVFLPSVLDAPVDAESSSEDPSDNASDDEERPDSSTEPEITHHDAEESPPLQELTEWPDEIPLPPADPIHGNDSVSFYLVEGDATFYVDYVETLLNLPDSELVSEEEREDENPSVWIRVGEYRVLVMHHPANDWVSVGVGYDFE